MLSCVKKGNNFNFLPVKVYPIIKGGLLGNNTFIKSAKLR